MLYVKRLLEGKLETYAQHFPCVLVAGARQVGKSTLVRHVFEGRATVFEFDPVQDVFGERSDPDLFLRNHPPPLVLDEIQYVPELVPAIKRYVDRHRRAGLFVLTGSQQWHVMRQLSESLAGRVALIDLYGYCMSEQYVDPAMHWIPRWLSVLKEKGEETARDFLMAASSKGLRPAELIFRGSFPSVQSLPLEVFPGWMRGYLATYLQRDIRQMIGVRDETRFASFLGLCAALTSQECNFSQIGRDIGVSTPTAQSWLSALRGTYQWMEIPAFSNNIIKRFSRKPKGYFADTGLACHLLRLPDPSALSGYPAFGALFETWVVMDIWKQVQTMPMPPALHHFRLHSGAEVDLILEHDGRFYPIEVKASSLVRPADARGISVFQELAKEKSGMGLVIYAGDRAHALGERCVAIPFDASIEI